MSVVEKLLYRFTAYLRCRVITGHQSEAYLERYHLLRLPFGYQVYLHRFVASDPGRALHNHPWMSAYSLLLSGGYTEQRLIHKELDPQVVSRRVTPGSVNRIGSGVYHRIELQPGEQAWSLFVHGPSHKSWGFLDTSQHRFRYLDHRIALSTASNPSWWKTAARPVHNPQMRLPAFPHQTVNNI